jgi:GDPmannose 4,6-dehydratase
LGLNWEKHVKIDPQYFRPAEVDLLLGDAAKARKVLGWKPTIGFTDLAKMMIAADMHLAENEKLLQHRSRQPQSGD